MNNIYYEIKINRYGRPYIDIPYYSELNSYNKFFTMEITKYILNELLN